MTVISYLILSVALFFVMVAIQAVIGIKQYGLVSAASARDGRTGDNVALQRAKRANANMVEAMVLFVPLALLAIQTGAIGSKVVLGAALFFWGRVAYAPLYWFGVPWLRTLAWAVSMVGIIIIFLTLLPFV